MPSPMSMVKFSGGVNFLLGLQIRVSDFAQQVKLSSRENEDNAKSMFV